VQAGKLSESSSRSPCAQHLKNDSGLEVFLEAIFLD
jgi:hypothetical protein